MSGVVSAKDETIRLFKSDFCEFFTRVHWSVPLIIYLPLILYCLFEAVTLSTMTVPTFGISFMAGLISWSLLEYLLHRFLFHFKPKQAWLKRVFYVIHEIHHEYPSDSLRLVMPPIESVPLAILFWWGLSTLLPLTWFYPFFAGLVLGYLSYDMIHYSVHHLPMKNSIAKRLKAHHLRHHFKNPNREYGVSSPFWDWVFRT